MSKWEKRIRTLYVIVNPGMESWKIKELLVKYGDEPRELFEQITQKYKASHRSIEVASGWDNQRGHKVAVEHFREMGYGKEQASKYAMIWVMEKWLQDYEDAIPIKDRLPPVDQHGTLMPIAPPDEIMGLDVMIPLPVPKEVYPPTPPKLTDPLKEVAALPALKGLAPMVDFSTAVQRVFLEVPQEHVGYIVGVKGSRIKKMKEMSGAYLGFEPPITPGGPHRLEIRGTPAQVEAGENIARQ